MNLFHIAYIAFFHVSSPYLLARHHKNYTLSFLPFSLLHYILSPKGKHNIKFIYKCIVQVLSGMFSPGTLFPFFRKKKLSHNLQQTKVKSDSIILTK